MIVMQCQKCNSENITFQAMEVEKKKKRDWGYYLFVSWWFEPVIWICAFPFMAIGKLLGNTKKNTEIKTIAVCQRCGNRWEVN